ncbi:hypothetical protein [Streptomyces thioluteus]
MREVEAVLAGPGDQDDGADAVAAEGEEPSSTPTRPASMRGRRRRGR